MSASSLKWKNTSVIKRMEFHVFLLTDNAGGHPVDLYHEGVQIKFLPPNTASLLQPMDQGVIRTFKALYTGNYLQLLFDVMDEKEDFQLKV
ncbi:HTH CENPB-type domain-containing protein [Nephila pilipes]|uniref:HTH CENPB-type domain-containing protein n=1 Tax=Nephila pilipes TaxID=299642 RepID=A0A8X6QZ71_NEPPI|nr:HTH CENPB-type domain-containing protein [Nephila pilipes]